MKNHIVGRGLKRSNRDLGKLSSRFLNIKTSTTIVTLHVFLPITMHLTRLAFPERTSTSTFRLDRDFTLELGRYRRGSYSEGKEYSEIDKQI